MPKSKRSRPVTLGDYKAEKKLRKNKEDLVSDVRECFGQYAYIWILHVENMRNTYLKEMRVKFRDSRFFFGKNAVMQVALGRDEAEELSPGLHKFGALINGQCGLFFTNEKKDYIKKYFGTHAQMDYARAGFIPTQTIELKEGNLDLSFSLETRLRSLGLPTLLKDGVIRLLSNYTVCKEGEPLTPEQARLLKLLGHELAYFRIHVGAMWGPDGELETYEVPKF